MDSARPVGGGVLDGVIIARRRADEGTNGDDLLDESIAFVQSTVSVRPPL